jgi:hypothetical protein
VHPAIGKVALDDWLATFARHGENHLPQITSLRATKDGEVWNANGAVRICRVANHAEVEPFVVQIPEAMLRPRGGTVVSRVQVLRPPV